MSHSRQYQWMLAVDAVCPTVLLSQRLEEDARVRSSVPGSDASILNASASCAKVDEIAFSLSSIRTPSNKPKKLQLFYTEWSIAIGWKAWAAGG